MPFRTPLHEIQSVRRANFIEYYGWDIAEHYGDPHKEYEAVRHNVGALDLCYLGKLRVSGRDRVRYLHNMVSNDVKGLAQGKGCYATLLTHQGRMESDLYVYAFPEELWLECLPASKQRLFETLNKYIVGDVVTVDDQTERWGVLSLQGPRSREKMEHVIGQSLEGLSPLDHRIIERDSGYRVVRRRDRTGCEGYDIWLPSEEVPDLWLQWIEIEKIAPVGHRALNWLRTEMGIPWYGVDMDDKTLPMEMALDSAISMTKGCYRGQEIVARVVHRGHLDRSLGAVTVSHPEPPTSGSEVRTNGARIGEITSAILSPRLGRPLGLAVLKKEFLRPGTVVEVVYDQISYPGEVVALPLK